MSRDKFMFHPKEIADYYNSTQVHYERWWGLKKYLSLHYGVWDDETRSFGEALINTNKHLLAKAGIKSNETVLDAGCGVGGAAFYVHENSGASVMGISLSEKQLKFAKTAAAKKGIENAVQFELMDFCNTSFEDASFDVIWACESICHAPDKGDFLKECFRLLKPGGRLVMFDFFLSRDDQIDNSEWIRKWRETWAVPSYMSKDGFGRIIEKNGFCDWQATDYTTKVRKSSKRMYFAALLGALPSEIYKLLHPNVTRFAKNHYKCGYYQYKALKAGLWKYYMFKLIK